MTKTASNVLFAYWSHDIGGFKGDPTDEMMVRWVQFGAVSPIFRTHGTRGTNRRVWNYPSFPLLADAMRLRARLAPYLYTQAREAYDSGVGTLRPMYYAAPDAEQAYAAHMQYMLGPLLLTRPVAEPADPATNKTTVAVWLPPPGRWVDWRSSAVADGAAALVSVAAALDELPLYAVAGAVLPLLPPNSTDVADSRRVCWCVMPGADEGAGERYDDAANTNAYARGEFVRQRVSYKSASKAQLAVTIHAAVGAYVGAPARVQHSIELRGRPVPKAASLQGRALAVRAATEGSLQLPAGAVTILVGELALSEAATVEITWA